MPGSDILARTLCEGEVTEYGLQQSDDTFALDESSGGYRKVGQNHHLFPVQTEGDPLDFHGSVASGIKGSDDGSHTGAGDDIRINAVLLENFQYSDMGQTACRAAAQGITYFHSPFSSFEFSGIF
jgi:hypothetical protein